MAKRRLSTYERLTGGKLNRKQRKDLLRKIASEDPGLEIVHPNAAGIDIVNESHYVAVSPDRDSQPVQEFGCWTTDLRRMAAWLRQCGIETVVMQSTGVYWIAVYEVLEEAGLRVWLCNARETRNLPGRKSDVQECQWLRKLHLYGLLRNSFPPAGKLRGLRTLWRLRQRHVQDASREVQHMQKALTSMNVQLANAISDASGVTGMAIIEASRGALSLLPEADWGMRQEAGSASGGNAGWPGTPGRDARCGGGECGASGETQWEKAAQSSAAI